METTEHCRVREAAKRLGDSDVSLSHWHHPEVLFDIKTFLQRELKLGDTFLDDHISVIVDKAVRHREAVAWNS